MFSYYICPVGNLWEEVNQMQQHILLIRKVLIIQVYHNGQGRTGKVVQFVKGGVIDGRDVTIVTEMEGGNVNIVIMERFIAIVVTEMECGNAIIVIIIKEKKEKAGMNGVIAAFVCGTKLIDMVLLIVNNHVQIVEVTTYNNVQIAMEMEVGIAIGAMEMDRLLVDNVTEKVVLAKNVIDVTVLEEIPSEDKHTMLNKNDNKKMLKEDTEEIEIEGEGEVA